MEQGDLFLSVKVSKLTQMNIDAYVPTSSRRFFWAGKESYSTQLAIQSLPDINKQNSRILDVWAGNSATSWELLDIYENAVITLLDQSYDTQVHEGVVRRKKVDLDEVNSISQVLGDEKFDIIFVNQVLQYVENPFGVIKHLFDNHLDKNGVMYFNISFSVFEHGPSVDDGRLFSMIEDAWQNQGVLEKVSQWSGLKQYHLRKNANKWLIIPEHKGYIPVGTQGFRRQKYSFVNLADI